MGCYGFGPARAAAAAVEQYADEHGISWPRTIAPFDVELVGLGQAGQRGARAGRAAVRRARRQGLQTLYDDRDAGPGEKFADAELLGCPLRVTVGRRTLAAGEIEVQVRRGRESRSVPIEGAAPAVARALARASRDEPGQVAVTDQITKRRLFGIDRSGPPPAADARPGSR